MDSLLQAASDAAKQTGAGKQPKFTELQQLCLSFVRSAKGNAAVDYIQPIEASGSDQVVELPEAETNTAAAKKRKSLNDDKNEGVYSKKHMVESWKEKYFESMTNNDDRLCKAKIRKIELESYNLLLKNISLERALDLRDHEIFALRSAISANLNEIPSYLSEFRLEEEVTAHIEETSDPTQNYLE